MSGPRGVGFNETSPRLQNRRVKDDIPRIQENNRSKGQVRIPRWWFEVDAYGAAVEGITMSIRHGMESGSIGLGELEILRQILGKLQDLDPYLEVKK